MELMEIIKSSLSIFSVVSFVFILTSYTIFKIKDRTRIKPYLRVNMQKNYRDLIVEEVVGFFGCCCGFLCAFVFAGLFFGVCWL